MKSLINSTYLDTAFVDLKYKQMQEIQPIGYIIIDDFLDIDFFSSCKQELDVSVMNVLSHDSKSNSQNKTIFVPGSKLSQLYHFFESQDFEQYISTFFGSNLKREFYIPEDVYEKVGITQPGLIGQWYEKGDFYDWHIDGSDAGISLGAFTYYVSGYNPEETNFSLGGQLELGKGNWGDITSYKHIQPVENRLILLLYKPNAFHRVTPVLSPNLNRISIQATLIKNN